MAGEPTRPRTSRPRPTERLPAVIPFDLLVRRHGPTVLRVSRALVGPIDADDVWSEAFLAALRAYPGLPADANHEAWLVTITHHKAVDAHRRRARRAVPLADAAEIADRVAAAAPAADAGLDRDTRLWESLQQLTDRQRHCVVHHHVGGLSYREIAALVGGTEAAARRAAADGIARLRLTLTPQEPS